MRGQWRSDAVYILAKELAYNVLNTRKTELKTALGKASGADIKRFADELKTHHDDIDKKLCKNGTADGDHTKGGVCGATSGSEQNKYGLHKSMGTDGAKHWPKISGGADSTKPYTKDATEKISDEMVGFNTDEKVKTAGLFARTVEEVRCSIYISEGTGV